MSVNVLTYSLHDATLMATGFPLPWGCKTKRKAHITSHSFSLAPPLFGAPSQIPSMKQPTIRTGFKCH